MLYHLSVNKFLLIIPILCSYLGGILARPHDGVRGPARAAPRPRDPGGARRAPLPPPHGEREAAPRGRAHYRRPRDQGSVRRLQSGRGKIPCSLSNFRGTFELVSTIKKGSAHLKFGYFLSISQQ
jgi:hypothetical protein